MDIVPSTAPVPSPPADETILAEAEDMELNNRLTQLKVVAPMCLSK